MSTIEVLEPTGTAPKLAPLQLNDVPELAGCRLAILDNRKPNFLSLATQVAERLKAERGVASIALFNKENAAVGAPAEVLRQIAESADLVLTGSAD
ncbi:MAG TPA: hypothetical protein PKC20_14965 [Burkholderiaceae bacterium]|nr:hypothetical protein [Burkholderiaceae bacterium]